MRNVLAPLAAICSVVIVCCNADALSSFEFLGNGSCAVTAGQSSYFIRNTYSQYRDTKTENCAQDALDAGARGFTVHYRQHGSSCRLHPQQDPGLSDSTSCPHSGCPASSPYGDFWGDDWMWLIYGGNSPILDIIPDSDHSCYRRTAPEEVDACLAHPCQNDGACTDVAGGGSDASGRTCACTRGFTGDNCETASTLALRCDDHNDKITCTGVDKCQWRRDTTTRTKSCFLKECRAFRNHRKCTSSDVGKELGCEFKGKRCQAPGEESECDAGNKRDCRAMDHCEWLRKDCRVKVVLTPGCGQYDTNASCKRRDNWPSDMNADTVCEWGNGVCTETEEVGCPAFKTQYECLRPLGVLLRCKWSRNRNNRGCRRQ